MSRVPSNLLPDTLLATLVDSAPDAMLVVDAGGRIVFANRMAEQIFGYAASELRDAPIERLIPDRIR
ncbi:MAG TPA: PAS domain-containing protein, partial [Steroidobacteraceae bacterium]